MSLIVCKNCIHYRVNKYKDANKQEKTEHVCYGEPPKVFGVFHGFNDSGVAKVDTYQMQRPVVKPEDTGCKLWRNADRGR